MRRLVLLVCLLALVAPATAAQQRRAPAKRPVSAAGFDKIAAQASEAFGADRLDEALELATKGVAMKPTWDEGWWIIASVHYQHDEYDQAATAYARATKLRPKSGLAWIMLGLCEYKLARYDQAAEHIVQGNTLGYPQNDQLHKVLTYHVGVLNLYRGEFEAAQKRLDDLAFANYRSEDLIVALGLTVLRIPQLPEQIRPGSNGYELVRQAGFAEYNLAQNNMQDAQREYDRLVSNNPTSSWVNYAYGVYKLKAGDEEAALASFKKEIEIAPTNAMARIQIAYIFLNRQQAKEGIPYAEEAVKLYPRYAQGHFLLGRILFDVGENDRAILELETSRDLAPDEPKIYYALARAYDKAKRKDDARKARDIFTALNNSVEQKNRAPAVRAADAAGTPDPAPTPN